MPVSSALGTALEYVSGPFVSCPLCYHYPCLFLSPSAHSNGLDEKEWHLKRQGHPVSEAQGALQRLTMRRFPDRWQLRGGEVRGVARPRPLGALEAHFNPRQLRV